MTVTASAARTSRGGERLSIAIWALLVGLLIGRGGQAVRVQSAASVTVTVSVTPTASHTPTTTTPAAGPSQQKVDARAMTVLNRLAVKGRAPKTGYSRDAFGQRWADVDRNGCDTRNDILRRDLAAVTLKAGTAGCVVLTGTLVDPYSGVTIVFERGPQSNLVQIDHVVSLSDAWQKGAQKLSLQERTALGNDPLNLLAVSGSSNASKGDGDAATWLPGRKAGRCAYVARQIAVKAKWGLWLTTAERDAMRRVLSACPSQPLPAG